MAVTFPNNRYPWPKWPLGLWPIFSTYGRFFRRKGRCGTGDTKIAVFWKPNQNGRYSSLITGHFESKNKILCWRRLFSFRVYVVSRRHSAGRILKAHVIISSGLRKIRNFSLVSVIKSSLMCYVPLDKSFKPFKNYSKSFQKAITFRNSAHT